MIKRLALTFPLVAGACWGCFGIFVRILYAAGFDNITITFMRAIVTLFLLALFILIVDRRLFRIRKQDLPLLVLLTLVGYIAISLSYNIAIQTLSLSLASILLCSAPVFVIIFGFFLYGEKITKTRVLCMLAVLAGCVLLSGAVEEEGLRWSLFGIAMGVLSSVCNAANTIMVKEGTDVRRIHPLTISFYTTGFAVLLMAPFADHPMILQFVAESPASRVPFCIAYALVASLIPNLLFLLSFRYLDAGVVAILESGMEPVSALLLGMIVYTEIPTPLGFAGMAITIAALIILTRSDARTKT